MGKKKSKHKAAVNFLKQTVASSDSKSRQQKSFQTTKPWSINGLRFQAVFIALLGLIFYANTTSNEFALDDGLVIVRNEYVQEGFSGLGDILTKDAFDSYYRQVNNTNGLTGGRYRPLSIVSFAIEQQFMGAQDPDSVQKILHQQMLTGITRKQKEKINHEMHIRHAMNVVWYILSVLALLYFFRYIVFKEKPMMAFVAAIIFAIHPIHTEVVANVKSRDEIMSVLFICLTFIFTFKWQEHRKKWMYAAAIGSYFLALLSKEYAITLIILLPLSLYLFNRNTIKKSILTVLPFLAVLALYLALRLHTAADVPPSDIPDNEVLNNPYLYASGTEAFATKISTSLNYVKLLLFPHPLSADYSYNSIPYTNFGNPVVWLSFAIYLGLAVMMIKLIPKKQNAGGAYGEENNFRNILCFAIAFYLLNFLLISNLVFNIGGTMGERLIYHSSIGFAIACGYLLVKGLEKIKPARIANIILGLFMAVLIFLSGYITVKRNREWKNDDTLFSADIKTVPNSVLVLGNMASSQIDKADQQKDTAARKVCLQKGVLFANRAIQIDPLFVAGFFNRGIAWLKLGELDSAKSNMDSVKVHYVNYPGMAEMYQQIAGLYLSKGRFLYGANKQWPEAIHEFKQGLSIDSTNAELWFQTGVAYYQNLQFTEAIGSWKTALRFRPGYPDAQKDLDFVTGLLNAANRKTK